MQVMEPIVEDAVPDVDRADETLRLMRLYGLLAAAVTQAAAALAAAAPTLLKDDVLPLSGLMTKLIADAVGAGLLPPTFDGAVNARLSVRRVLRPRRRSATGGEDVDVLRPRRRSATGGEDGEGFGAAAVPRWDDPIKDETDDALDTAPSPWYVHVVC